MFFIIICFLAALSIIISLCYDYYKDKKRYNDVFSKYEEFLKNKQRNNQL